MTDKFDPVLSEHLERAGSAADETADQPIDVIVALTRPADDDLLADLATRGLDVRSVTGDILTGSAAPSSLATIAESDDITSIDAGGALTLEPDDPASASDSPAPTAEPDSFDTPTG